MLVAVTATLQLPLDKSWGATSHSENGRIFRNLKLSTFSHLLTPVNLLEAGELVFRGERARALNETLAPALARMGLPSKQRQRIGRRAYGGLGSEVYDREREQFLVKS